MVGNQLANTVTKLLGLDHDRLDAMLAATKHALRSGDSDSARTRFDEFRAGLEHHIEAEEQLLFPAYEQLTGAAGVGPVAVMRKEHRELRTLLRGLTELLEAGGSKDYVTPMAALTAHLYAHNGKEERILYPATDRAAAEAGTLDGLVHELAEF